MKHGEGETLRTWNVKKMVHKEDGTQRGGTRGRWNTEHREVEHEEDRTRRRWNMENVEHREHGTQELNMELN